MEDLTETVDKWPLNQDLAYVCTIGEYENVLKSMKKWSGLSELSVMLWVSAVEGCLLWLWDTVVSVREC